ncbi:MAG: hypothetical protein ILA19_00990 [Bacilli bacterium]|nr:hypothetical protein [Bacilli bacterium]
MNKKIEKLIILFIAILITTACSYRTAISINDKIILPEAVTENVKFTRYFRDGQDFVVFKYEEKQKNEIIKKYNLKKISNSNIEEVQKVIDDFYDRLNQKNKKIFDKTIKKEELIRYGNYYLIRYEEYNRFTVLIFNEDNLYYFKEM